MSNEMKSFDSTNLPATAAGAFDLNELAGDLTEGVGGGFGVVSFRGSKWRIKYAGDETLITNEDGEAKPSLEAVLVKASKAISKIFYSKKYEEGDDSAPDCWSIDGVTPDPAATNKQHANCATCPNNVWGSRMTDSGKKAKACADNRRIAVVPLNDLNNETFGGPMLMRVPAASLADLAQFGNLMAKKGYPYNAIGTRVGFDPNASYPKLTFKAMRPLSDEERAQILEHFKQGTLDRILSEGQELAPETEAKVEQAPEPVKAVDTDFEQETPEPVQQEMDFEEPKPKATTKKKTAAKAKGNGKAKPVEAAPEPAAPVVPTSDLEEELNDILDGMDDL